MEQRVDEKYLYMIYNKVQMSTMLRNNHGIDCYMAATNSSGLLQIITGQHPIAIGKPIYGGLLPGYQCYKVYMALLTTLPFS